MMHLEMRLNGARIVDDVAPHVLLVEYLRDVRGLTGTKVGCETSVCGACTVLVDGSAVKSCTMLAVQAERLEITTIEGLADGGRYALVSEAMQTEHGVQCGFCTPGLVASITALLDAGSEASDEAVLAALEGHLCRCTGYVGILRAVRRMIAIRRGESPLPLAGTALADPVARHDADSRPVAGADVEVV